MKFSDCLAGGQSGSRYVSGRGCPANLSPLRGSRYREGRYQRDPWTAVYDEKVDSHFAEHGRSALNGASSDCYRLQHLQAVTVSLVTSVKNAEVCELCFQNRPEHAGRHVSGADRLDVT